MANRTVKDARTVKGTNPQYLIEKIIRTRIYESKYWKEECFALSGMYCGNGTTVACQKSPPPTELQIPATVTILVFDSVKLNTVSSQYILEYRCCMILGLKE